MRLSEVLACRVIDASGEEIGSVNDVRLVQDGAYVEGFGAGLRVEGFVTGSGRLGERLGYHRGGVEGPWILRTFFARQERRGRYVPWSKVDAVEGDVIRLSCSRGELEAFAE
jgi:sporulation protein YlmC with PRC-barrel domain